MLKKLFVCRASSLLTELKAEEFEQLRNGRKYDDIRAGDSIAVDRLPFSSSKEVETIKGVVIAKTNRASDTAIKILNVRQKISSLLS